MKRRIACTLVILLALLCGCQAPNPDNIDEEEFREELQEAMRDVVADSGEAVPVVNYHAPKGTWLPLNSSPD